MKKIITLLLSCLVTMTSFAQSEVTIDDVMTKPLAIVDWKGNIWNYTEEDFMSVKNSLKFKQQKPDKTIYAARIKETFFGYKSGIYVQIANSKLKEYSVTTTNLKPSNATKVIEDITEQLKSKGVNLVKGNSEECATLKLMHEYMKMAWKPSSIPECMTGSKGNNTYYLFSAKMMGVVSVVLAVRENIGSAAVTEQTSVLEGGGLE